MTRTRYTPNDFCKAHPPATAPLFPYSRFTVWIPQWIFTGFQPSDEGPIYYDPIFFLHSLCCSFPPKQVTNAGFPTADFVMWTGVHVLYFGCFENIGKERGKWGIAHSGWLELSPVGEAPSNKTHSNSSRLWAEAEQAEAVMFTHLLSQLLVQSYIWRVIPLMSFPRETDSDLLVIWRKDLR